MRWESGRYDGLLVLVDAEGTRLGTILFYRSVADAGTPPDDQRYTFIPTRGQGRRLDQAEADRALAAPEEWWMETLL